MRGCGDEQLVAAYKLSFTKALGLYYHIPPTYKAPPWLQVCPTIIQVVHYSKCCLDKGIKWKNNSYYRIPCFHKISPMGYLLIMQLDVYLQPAAI